MQEKVYRAESLGDYAYECFYWDNVPAYSAAVIDNSVWFGTADGRVCRFNGDWDSLDRFNDYTLPDLGGLLPVNAFWATKLDEDEYSGRYKTLLKRGTCITLKPYVKSSVKIELRTDKDYDIPIGIEYADLFSWERIYFDRFTFVSNIMPRQITVGKKIRRYKYLQFVLSNNNPGEGFGVYEITKYYTLGNYMR